MRSRTELRAAALAVVLGGSLAGPAAAYFEATEVGARGLALGRTFVAIADDATAIYWNPAGLVQVEGGEVFLNHHRPYLIPDLTHGFAGASFAIPIVTVYGAWSHLGLSGVQSEDLLYAGVARALWRGDGRLLSIGATVKAARVSYSGAVATASDEPVDLPSQTQYAGDLGVYLRLGPRLSLGYMVRNLGDATWDFVPGNGETILDHRQEFGAAYRWHPEALISAAVREGTEGNVVFSGGAEIEFYDVFALRLGLGDMQFSGGVGIMSGRLRVDAGFVTHSELGITTMFSLLFGLGGGS